MGNDQACRVSCSLRALSGEGRKSMASLVRGLDFLCTSSALPLHFLLLLLLLLLLLSSAAVCPPHQRCHGLSPPTRDAIDFHKLLRPPKKPLEFTMFPQCFPAIPYTFLGFQRSLVRGLLPIPSICLPQTSRSCSAIPICQNVEMVLQTTPVPSNGLDCHAILHGK